MSEEVEFAELRTPERAALLIAAQDAQIATLVEQVEQWSKRAENAEAERNTLRADLYDEHNTVTGDNFCEMQQRAEKAEAELATANDEIDALTSKLASTEYGGYKSRISKLEAELAAMTEQVEAREEYIQFIREGLHALEDRCGIKSKDEPGDATIAIAEAVHSLKAELAALREGKVYYRPYGESGKYLSAEDVRKDYPGYKVVESRERILDADGGEG